MNAVRLAASLVLVFAVCSPATAQVRGVSYSQRNRSLGDRQPAADSSQLNRYARSGYSSAPFAATASCNESLGSRLSAYRLNMMQKRRDDEKERRDAARKAIPVRTYTDDELAESQFNIARLLYRGGKPEASRRQLELLIEKWPTAMAADKAQVALGRF